MDIPALGVSNELLVPSKMEALEGPIFLRVVTTAQNEFRKKLFNLQLICSVYIVALSNHSLLGQTHLQMGRIHRWRVT